MFENFCLNLLWLEVFEHLSNVDMLYTLIITNTILILYDVIKSYILYKITLGETNLIMTYIVLEIFNECLKYLTDKKLDDIAFKVKNSFVKKALTKYNFLSWQSKNILTEHDFYMKMNDVIDVIGSIIRWGMLEIINTIGILLQCLIIFISQNMYIPLIWIILINVIMYFTYIKSKQHEFNKQMQSTILESDVNTCKIKLELPLFAQKEKSIYDIYRKITKSLLMWMNLDNLWHEIMFIDKLANIKNNIFSFLFYLIKLLI